MTRTTKTIVTYNFVNEKQKEQYPKSKGTGTCTQMCWENDNVKLTFRFPKKWTLLSIIQIGTKMLLFSAVYACKGTFSANNKRGSFEWSCLRTYVNGTGRYVNVHVYFNVR